MMSVTSQWLVPRGRTRLAAGVVALAAGVASAVALVVHDAETGDRPDDVAFTVGEQAVTTDDLDARVAVLTALYGVQVPGDADAKDRFRRDAAKSMAISMVMDEEAAQDGITVSEQDASNELDAFLEEAGDDRAFEDFLTKHELTEGEVLAELKRTLAVGRLYESVIADLPRATVEEARRVFESDPARFRTEPARVLRNIVVGSRAEAVDVLRRLRAGERFADVAQEVSLDQSTSAQGGLLGTLTLAELEPDFGEAAFAAPMGRPFGPVRGQYGWNVAWVDREVPSRQLTFADVRDRLVQSLDEQRQQEAWVDWVNEAIADAHIDYADAYRPETLGIDATDDAILTPEPTTGPTSPATP